MPEDRRREEDGQESVGEESQELAPPEYAAPEYLAPSPAQAAAEMAATRATLRRIEQMSAIAGILCALAVGLAGARRGLGWPMAAGVLLGTGLGEINFRWLAASVNAIGERIVRFESRERGASVVLGGVGRVVLIAVVGYGIFACSLRGLLGYLVGLAMPAVAMMCEAAYEFAASIRRRS